ncbi:hypothetical protein LPJ78_000671 [Coemansia sp. RSA 989]|nr:hypothetical protein BX667DRAFT_495938 [Coemansia mojavensis]KAJ1744124.1 hypothetical protein LPJ68_000354 [Coemansia sp. RSA 1086]KAJ1867799.1 hypothetical protein LPJ78_000671 [Coemansia sp. RSA 989]KAJ1874713.1 hypothetical protein LPJ55_001320 [Coemansia sp. RSA 990]KAJ2673680.1 hypothetical protein IWW42_002092 [Coemansia sp. RSA 1085]
MVGPSEAVSSRRRVPDAAGLDVPASKEYRGKIIKKTIERNRASTIKRKYFKELKKEAKKAQKQDTEHSDNHNAAETGDHSSGAVSAPNDRAISRRKHKPNSNPFQKVLREREQIKKQKEEEKRRREQEIRQAEMQRIKYAHKRKADHKRHSARTSRGQPVLSSQITGILKKLQKK